MPAFNLFPFDAHQKTPARQFRGEPGYSADYNSRKHDVRVNFMLSYDYYGITPEQAVVSHLSTSCTAGVMQVCTDYPDFPQRTRKTGGRSVDNYKICGHSPTNPPEFVIRTKQPGALRCCAADCFFDRKPRLYRGFNSSARATPCRTPNDPASTADFTGSLPFA